MAEPESIDINELASRIEALDKEPADAGETPETDREHAAEQAEQARVGADGASADGSERNERSDEGADGVHEGDDVTDDAAESGEEGGSDEIAGADAPEFWSADDKAFWAKIPAEVRPLVKKYEEQRVEFANQQRALASETKRKADEEIRKATDLVSQGAAYWEQNGQKFIQAFGDKWAKVDWGNLATNNPAEWARLKEEQSQEHQMLQQAHAIGQRDIQIRNKRQEDELQSAKVAEHAKVATKLPDYFGTPERAAKTYDDIGKYLFSKGIPAERINTIYEAPIIELALKAKLYDDARAKASAVTSSGATKNPATPAPTRVAPGPAARTANRGSEAARQAKQRFMQNNNDMDAAAEYLRLSGLA